MELKRKVVRSTQAQLRLLVDHMSANRLFALGEFSGPLGAQNMEAEWANLRDLLAEHGSPKTIIQWKHTWRDLKKKAREEGAKSRHAQGVTGNHVLIPEVSNMTKKILDTIGRESAEGLSVEAETGLGEFIVLPESDLTWMSPSPLLDADADTKARPLSSPRSGPGLLPHPAPWPSPRPRPVSSPGSSPGSPARPVSGSWPRPAQSPSLHTAPCHRPSHARGPSPHTAPGPSPRTVPGPSPHPAAGPSPRRALVPAVRLAPRPTPTPPSPPSPPSPQPPSTPDTPLQQTPAPPRPRARRRQARAMDSATRPTAQFIAQQNQQILHLQELVLEQRIRNVMLHLKIRRARRLNITAFNNLRF